MIKACKARFEAGFMLREALILMVKAARSTYRSVMPCKLVASQALKTILKAAFPQVDGFTPYAETIYSPSTRKKAPGETFPEVVATCLETATGYQPFPQVRAFTPQTCGIYSPSLATKVVATLRLPTGYQREPAFRGVNPDVSARGGTYRPREHILEM